MKIAINQNALKTAVITITAVGTIGLGYLGCQVFGRAAMFTTAGCLTGLGCSAALIENVKPTRVITRKRIK